MLQGLGSRSVRVGFGVLIALAGFMGCDTIRTAPARGNEEIRSVLPVPAARQEGVEEAGSGILLAFDFIGDEEVIKGSGCRLRFEDRQTRQAGLMHLKPEASAGFVSLPPGIYHPVRLGCGLNAVWSLDEVYSEGIRVEDDKVSYLGKLGFEFKGRELETIRKAPRAESIQAFVNSHNELGFPTRTRFISAFTGREIDASATTSPGGDSFDVFAKGMPDASRALLPLLNELKVCGAEAGKKDPLRFGRLIYVASYRSGRFNALKEKQEENAFSDEFRGCVERALSRYRPNVLEEVEVRVTY